MALQIATVTDSISKLNVSGVVIKDKDQIPAAGDERRAIIIPLPTFITDITMVRDSFGPGSSAKMTFYYTLNYRLLYKKIGTGRAPKLEPISELVNIIGRFWDAIMAIDVFDGAVDITPYGMITMGPVKDPSDETYWGADFSVRIMEFVN